MAYDVEDKVVQMRFDNRDFDPNIDASVKSLEKLEKSLQLADGVKGLENVSKAAKNMDFSPIVAGIEQVSNQFSTMEVVAITTIANITNRFVNMGANILHQLFITPLTTGWAEYGQQMDSTQVIMANTGETLDKVTESLDQLNEYADLTIYSFGQMTQAIGKFAAAGVNLDDSVASIKGLSNAAALVGANGNQLFSAYYNLSQALQVGYLQLIDWRPILNSTIGTKTMQKAFIETAIAMGKFEKGSEQANKAYSNFKDSLQSRWLTKDVMVEALKIYSIDVKSLRQEVDATTGAIKYFNEQGEEVPEWMIKIANSATRAATEVKSLGQLWDVLKEEAQTGWADNWKIIIGDLNQAKELWTNVSDRITAIIGTINNGMSSMIKNFVDLGGRDTLIEALMQVLNNLRMTLIPFFRVLDTIINISAESLKNFADGLLDTAKSFSLSKEQGEALFQVLKVLTIPLKIFLRFNMLIIKSIKLLVDIAVESAKLILNVISGFKDGFVGILRLLGLTEDEIYNIIHIADNIRAIIIKVTDILFGAMGRILKALAPGLAVIAKAISMVISVIAKVISVIANSNFEWFENLLYVISIVIQTIVNSIYSIVSSIHEAMGSGLGTFLESVGKILSFVATLLSRILVVATYFISGVIEKASPLLGAIGNLLMSVANAIFSIIDGLFDLKSEDTTQFFNTIIKGLTIAIQYLSQFINKIVDVINGVASMINGKNWKNVGATIVSSFTKGFKSAVPVASKAVTAFGDTVTENVRDTLEVHSPSPLFIDIGSWIPKSISKGIDNNAETVEKSSDKLLNSITKVFNKRKIDESAQEQLNTLNSSVAKTFETIDRTMYIRLGIIAAAIAGVIVLMAILISKIPNMNKAFDNVGSGLKNMANSFAGIGQAIKGLLNDIGKSFRTKANAEMIKALGISLLLFAGAVSLLVLTFSLADSDKAFYKMLIIIGLISSVLIAVTVLGSQIAKDADKQKSLAKVVSSMNSILVSLSLFMAALSLVGNKSIDDNVIAVLLIVAAVVSTLSIIGVRFSKMSKNMDLKHLLITTNFIQGMIGNVAAIIIMLRLISDKTIDSNVVSVIATVGLVATALSLLGVKVSKQFNKESDYKKIIAGFVLINIMIGSISAIIPVLSKISGMNFDMRVNTILLSLTVSISILSKLASKLIKDNDAIKRSIVSMFIVITVIGALNELLKSLSKIADSNYDIGINLILVSLTGTIGLLSILAAKLINNNDKIKRALSGIPILISVTGSLTLLINQLNKIANSNYDIGINLILVSLTGTIGLLTILASNLIKSNDKIKNALVGTVIISAMTANLAYLCNALSKLGDQTFDNNINLILETLTVAIALLSVIATVIVTNTRQIGKSLIGLLVMVSMTGVLTVLMNQLKKLQGLDVSWEVIGQLAVIEALVLAMAAIGIAIGHGSYYVAIGVAAIIGISGALLIAAHALKVFSASDMDNLVNGFVKFRDAMTGGENFGRVMVLAVGLIVLSIAIALIAPGIDLLAIAALGFGFAIKKMSEGIHQIISDIRELFDTIKASGVQDKNMDLLKFLSEDLDDAAVNLRTLAGSIALLGAAFAALGIGATFIAPVLMVISALIGVLFRGINNLIDNLYKVKNFILALADRAEDVDKVLTSLKDNITGLKTALAGVTALTAFDKGRTPSRIIIALAKAFAIASRGAIAFGIGLKQIALGIILMSLAINIAKQLIGDELSALMDQIRTKVQALMDKFGAFGTMIILFAQNVAKIAALDAISAFLWILGKRLQSFGMGLIKVSIGAILFSFAMKKIAEGLNYVSETDASRVISGIVVALIALVGVAKLLGPLESLLKKAGKGIKSISVALILLSGAILALSYVMNLAQNYIQPMITMFYMIAAFSAVMGIISPLAILAGVAIGTLGASLTLLDLGLVGLVGVLILLKNTLGGMSTLWEFYGFLTAFSATMGVLAIPTILAGVAIGTLAAGLFALSLALLALSGALALFANVVSQSELLQAVFTNISNSVHQMMDNIKKSILYGIYNVVSKVTKFIENVKTNFPAEFEKIGWWIPESLKNGLISGVEAVANAAATIGNTIMETIRNILDVHSESPTGNEIGWWESISIGNGLESGAGYVGEKAAKVGNALWEGFNTGTNGKAGEWVSDFKKNVGKKANDLKDWVQNDLLDFGEGGLFGNVSDMLSGDGVSKIFDVFSELEDVEFDVDNAESYADALANIGDSASSSKGTIETLTDTLKNQMKIFERFTADEEIMNPKELINNMKSQLRGMQNWANGIDELAVRGMSGPLLQYLSEMGPEGYKYVEAFLEMTESEFQEANSLYADSLEMPGKTANQIAESYKRAGVEIVEAVASGMSSGTGAIDKAGKDIDEKVMDNIDWTARRSKKISIDGVTTTQGTIADLVAKYGPDTALTYVRELDKWMDSDQFRVYAASVQGKVGAIFQFNTNQLSDALKNVTYVMDQETLVTGETAKKLKANTQTILRYVVDGVQKTTNASEYMKACEKAGYMIGAEILNGSRRSLGINSPSKEYEEVGKYSVLGMVKGITENMFKAENISEELGDTTIDTLSDTIKAISTTFTDDLDTTPTIRPVLDLSNVYDGMGQLDTLFSSNQARIAASAYASNKSSEDGVSRLQSVIDASNDRMARQIVQAIQNSDQPITVNVTLNGDAADFFDAMVEQTRSTLRSTGSNPLLITRSSTINAGKYSPATI